jgi:hypothetical protein
MDVIVAAGGGEGAVVGGVVAAGAGDGAGVVDDDGAGVETTDVVVGVALDGFTLPLPPPPPQALNEAVNANAMEKANTLLRPIIITLSVKYRHQPRRMTHGHARIRPRENSDKPSPCAHAHRIEHSHPLVSRKKTLKRSSARGDSRNRPPIHQAMQCA